jgi:hypothetical protein
MMKQEDFITAYQHVMSLTNVKPYKRPRKNYQVNLQIPFTNATRVSSNKNNGLF